MASDNPFHQTFTRMEAAHTTLSPSLIVALPAQPAPSLFVSVPNTSDVLTEYMHGA